MAKLKLPSYGEMLSRYEKGRRKYFSSPGVVKTSEHMLKRGWGEYYVDFDNATFDPTAAEDITYKYANELRKILTKKPIHYLGFIEKHEGTAGAIKISVAVSILTGVPNILIRPYKDIEFERIKIPPKTTKTRGKQLEGSKIVLITDHCTTGTEVLECANIVKENGGKVTDVITYTSRPKIKENLEKFEKEGIEFHSIYPVSERLEKVFIDATTEPDHQVPVQI